MKEISEIARLQVKEAIENVSGVGAVLPVGNWTRAVNVVLDLDKLQSYGIPDFPGKSSPCRPEC